MIQINQADLYNHLLGDVIDQTTREGQMGNPDLRDQSVRKNIIDEINHENNKDRKEEHLKRFEVYQDRQHKHLLEKLRGEFSDKTVREMRKISSINLTKRITNELASIYNTEPMREFGEVSDREIEQIENLYHYACADQKLKLANRYYKLHGQAAIQILPRDNRIMLRALQPQDYDVIPDAEYPEKAYAYILNVFDKYDFLYAENQTGSLDNPRHNNVNQGIRREADRINQKIADRDDYRAKMGKYIVWTDKLMFMMDGSGQIISEETENPIGMLPFVDVALDKDMEFFVRAGNSIVDFALDYSLLLSDTATINKMQGWAQPIISATELPQDMQIGPNHILYLPIDPNNPTATPSFEFANPSPDMSSSLELLETYLRLFLSSQGIDPKTVSGKAETQRFSSGIERLLAMVEKFEASRSDIDLFRKVEDDVFKLMVAWSNAYQGVTGDKRLIDDLNKGKINDNATMEIQFVRPEMLQTKAEKEESVMKLLDAGLMSKKEAIMHIREVDEEMAIKILEEIDGDEIPVIPPQFPPQMIEDEDGQEEPETEKE